MSIAPASTCPFEIPDPMQQAFIKMHGLGNDFVVVHADADTPLPPARRIRELADRRRGIGFDQLLWISPDPEPDVAASYRVANADGGEVAQCGNGARCIAMSLASRGVASPMRLRSPAGLIEARVDDDTGVSVTMGVPETAPASIPFVADRGNGPPYRIDAAGHALEVYVVSMGNPHAVIFCDSVASAPVASVGAALQNHSAFPERVNVGFLELTAPGSGALRVYERGVGETRACGTGACAAAVAARLAGHEFESLALTLPGGQLMVSWRGDRSPVWLSGPAETSFEGIVHL